MENRSSKTAVDVLAARAVNTIAPYGRRIIEDRYAAKFLPAIWLPIKLYFSLAQMIPFLYWIPRFIAKHVGSGADSIIALRHRIIDERLIDLCNNGIKQVVLLGAGFDSRALRFKTSGIRFIEIDHPCTQANKIKIINDKTDVATDHVHFIPVDFRNDWIKTVSDTGLIHNIPTLFIWEGVSYYLPCEAVTYTLEGLKKLTPKGSTLIFDFFPREIANPETADPQMIRMRAYGAARGEHFLWGCDRDEIGVILAQHDYQHLNTTTMGEFASFLNHTHGMNIPFHDIFNYLILAEASL